MLLFASFYNNYKIEVLVLFISISIKRAKAIKY